MTVKELLSSVNFPEIVHTLIKRYGNTDSLRPLHIYKQDYDTLCNIEFSGKSRTITYNAENGDSDIYMIEGDSFRDITGSEIILSSDTQESRITAAAEILWCASPFGGWTTKDWNSLSDYLSTPSTGALSETAKKARRFYFLQYLPCCKDKQMRREVITEMNRPVDEFDEVAFSWETSEWLILNRRPPRKLNRSKRKREYRMQKRYEELVNRDKQEHFLSSLTSVLAEIPNQTKKAVLRSSNIDTQIYKSRVFGKSDRIEYLSDLLLNPLYANPTPYIHPNQYECIGIVFTSKMKQCSEVEFKRIETLLAQKFKDTRSHLFHSIDDSLGNEIALKIHKIFC